MTRHTMKELVDLAARISTVTGRAYTLVLHPQHHRYMLVVTEAVASFAPVSPPLRPNNLFDWLTVYLKGLEDMRAIVGPSTTTERPLDTPWYCQDCRHEGTEDEFIPEVPGNDEGKVHACPECNSFECFEKTDDDEE